MAESVKGSWCTASNLADVIVRERQLSFRQVHHIVARAVRHAVAEGLRPDQLTSVRLDEAALETVGIALRLGDAAVRDALDPVRFVETRVTDGGVGPRQVERLLERAAEERAADRQWLGEARGRLNRARVALDEAVGKLVA